MISYNVNGISTKLDKMLSRVVFTPQHLPPDIILLQEIRADVQTYQFLCQKLPMYCSYGSIFASNAANKVCASCGVYLGFKKSLDVKVLDTKLYYGWFVMVKCLIENRVCVIGSIYMPAVHNVYASFKEYVDELVNTLNSMQCEHIFLAGDLNCSFSLLDNSKVFSSTHATHAAYFKSKLIDVWELEDIWRIHNPWSKKFTHFSTDDRNSSRLDYCLVSSNFTHLIKDCDIHPAYGSDHTPPVY